MRKTLRAHLARRCPEEDLCRWYDPLLLDLDKEDGCLTVTFPHRFFESWFSREGKEYFESCLSACLGKNIDVRYRTRRSEDYAVPSMPQVSERGGVPKEKPFGEDCTLENFMANKKNFFPLAVAQEAVKTHKDPSYNPLVYCGKSGSGKTHLLRALANELSMIFGDRAVFYGNTEQFAQERVQRKNSAARKVYKAYCIDDIHHMANDTQLQEELTLLLDDCLYGKMQIVCACSELPSPHKGFSESLRSRLERGIVAELKNPDLDVRMRFTKSRCALHDMDITKEQMLFLAQRCEHLHYLSGIILKTAAFQKLIQRKITDQDLEKIFENSNNYNMITPQSIIRRVASHFSLTPEDITGAQRKPATVFARQTAMYICRDLMGTSYPVLGRIFGGKDHSTIIYSIKKIEKYLAVHKEAHKEFAELKHLCLHKND